MMKYSPYWFLLGACVIFGSRVNRGSAELLDEECGLSPIGNRIAGGRAAIQNTTPWIVFIRNRTNFLCGGSLISKTHVLTAAHCVTPTPKTLIARLGEYNWGPEDVCIRRLGCIPSERDYNVLEIHKHPQYQSVEYNDIAILRLKQEVRYTAHVRPICVLVKGVIGKWQEFLKLKLKHLSMNGWGATKNSNLSRVLQTANLTLIDHTTCRNYYTVDETHICAGDPQRYVCSGDSGSPLGLLVPSNGTDYYIQLGIVSNGKLPCRGVAVFTNVLSYANWISSVVTQNKTINKPSLGKNRVEKPNTRISITMRKTRLNGSG